MTHFHLWTEASALPIKGLTLYVVELLRNHRFWYQDFVDKMRRHEERLVDADSDSERQDHTQWPYGEWLAMMAHGKHVLVSGYPVPSTTTWSKLLILDPTWQTTGPTHWPLTRPEKTGCDSLALDPTRKWVWLNDVWPDPKKLGQTHWPLTWPNKQRVRITDPWPDLTTVDPFHVSLSVKVMARTCWSRGRQMPMYRSTVKTTMIQADVKRNTYEMRPYIEHMTAT